MKTSRVVALVSILLVIAACGGSTEGSTTVPADGTTTGGADATSLPDQTTAPDDDPGTITDISDMPAECIDAFSAFLQQIEPIVKDIDFENSTLADLEAMGNELEPISDAFEEETADCPDLDLSDEESLALMRELAERDAPGTAAYFAWVEALMVSVDDGGAAVSGDCETDIAALQEYVDQGGTMADLTVGEITAFGSLMAAASTECSVDRFQEWVSQEDVAAWTEA
ncbi:MAG: hypothetical protein WD895_05960 [Acidimicrobiia bacterium]